MTTTRTVATATPTHGVNVRAETPARESTRKISCGASATEDSASDANTGNAIRLRRLVAPMVSLREGRPTRRRLVPTETFEILDTGIS